MISSLAISRVRSQFSAGVVANLFTAIITLAIATGCEHVQPVALLQPDQRDHLVQASNTVVAGTITRDVATADLTFAEDHLEPYPSHPKNGYKMDLTIAIDEVVKGSADLKALELRALKDRMHSGSFDPSLGIYVGQRVFVGWASESSGTYESLMIVRAGDGSMNPTTAPSAP